MTDKLELQKQEDILLKKQLEKVDWTIDYGSIKVQVREGKATFVVIERTVKLD